MKAAQPIKSNQRAAEKPAVCSVRAAAQKLKRPNQHVLNLIEEGKLAAINIGTGNAKIYRVLLTSLEGAK